MDSALNPIVYIGNCTATLPTTILRKRGSGFGYEGLLSINTGFIKKRNLGQ